MKKTKYNVIEIVVGGLVMYGTVLLMINAVNPMWKYKNPIANIGFTIGAIVLGDAVGMKSMKYIHNINGEVKSGVESLRTEFSRYATVNNDDKATKEEGV